MRLRPQPISDERASALVVALTLYRGIMHALSPALLRRRARIGKEDASRLSERNGLATRPRPDGPLIWIHGASVGESLAVLPLVAVLLEKPDRHVLVTTGTVTSAQLMAERLPPRALHQYVPVDSVNSVRRFLSYWRPDLALFVESELWPNLILETRRMGVPLALVNARLSAKSFAGWGYAPRLARRILSCFDACLAQDEDIAKRLTALGASHVRVTGSLKADAPPLPVDEYALAGFRAGLGARPVFLAASTHAGEEEIVLDVATMLRDEGARTLTVIVPRHPGRGAEIAALAASRGFSVARRANHELLTGQTEVYVADTLGELGLFYRAAQFAFVGGSLVPHGGQNPLEPAGLGVAVIVGPHTENFDGIVRALLNAQSIGRVTSKEELFSLVQELTRFPERALELGTRVKIAAGRLGGALAATVELSETMLACHARA